MIRMIKTWPDTKQ